MIDILQSALVRLTKRPGDEVVKDQGHPPSATGRVCVDFDQTLYPFGELFGDRQPIEGAVEAMRKIKESGKTIYIWTSRLSPDWWTKEGWDHAEAERQQITYMTWLLNRDGIPFDHMTGEKLPGLCYIDDKAIEFTGTNWPEIAERVAAL